VDRWWLGGSSGHPAESRADFRLLCLPYAGGGAAAFREWHRAAPPGVEVYALELPGRGSRLSETPFRRLGPLVRAVADSVEWALDRPYALFGHSMGGLLAFELTRALRRRGAPPPQHLFVSAAAPPGTRPTQPPLHCAPDHEVKERLRTLGGTPPVLLDNDELMDLVLPTLRADFSVLETYEYADEPPLPVPITAFGGLADRVVPPSALVGWRRESSEGARVRLFPGDHFFVNSAVAEVTGAVARVLGPRPGPARAYADSGR
jgi:surfactin synthase thioesterase subunit